MFVKNLNLFDAKAMKGAESVLAPLRSRWRVSPIGGHHSILQHHPFHPSNRTAHCSVSVRSGLDMLLLRFLCEKVKSSLGSLLSYYFMDVPFDDVPRPPNCRAKSPQTCTAKFFLYER
jgi:hypothetical protein